MTQPTSIQLRLAELESEIAKGREAWKSAGAALIEIRDGEYYSVAGFDTFWDYCETKWGWKKRNVNTVISSYEAFKSLPPAGQNFAHSASQARALSKAPASKRVEALETACERAESEGRPLTAAHIKTAVEELNETKPNGGEPTEHDTDRPEPTSPARPHLPDLTQVKNDIAAAISEIEAFETGAEDFTLDNCANVANALRDAAKELLKAQREF